MKTLLFTLFTFSLVAVPAFAGQRYISLAPSTTEILFALGLDEEIIGVSSFCSYPEQAQHKPKVGDFSQPNLEKIASLKPDYVFCTGLEQAPVVEELKRLKLKVYVADPANFQELFATIREIGNLTNRTQKAEALIKKMNADIETIQSKVKLIAHENRVSVFIELWHEPLMTAGNGSLIDELITLAGGINIAHDAPRPYCNFSSEKVVASNPDVIIVAYMDKEHPLKLLEKRLGWASTNAVKNKKIFNDINPNLLLRPGPRTTEGLKELYRRFYCMN